MIKALIKGKKGSNISKSISNVVLVSHTPAQIINNKSPVIAHLIIYVVLHRLYDIPSATKLKEEISS